MSDCSIVPDRLEDYNLPPRHVNLPVIITLYFLSCYDSANLSSTRNHSSICHIASTICTVRPSQFGERFITTWEDGGEINLAE